jgi:colicin import membrane protein
VPVPSSSASSLADAASVAEAETAATSPPSVSNSATQPAAAAAISEPLPAGWTEQKTKEGRIYFFHSETKKSTWKRPTQETLKDADKAVQQEPPKEIPKETPKETPKDTPNETPKDATPKVAKKGIFGLLAKNNQDTDKSKTNNETKTEVKEHKRSASLMQQAFSLGKSIAKENPLLAIAYPDKQSKEVKEMLAKLGDPTQGFADEELIHIFDAYDVDKDGELSPDEAEQFFTQLIKYGDKGYTKADLDAWFVALDEDGSKKLSKSEMSRSQVTARRIAREKAVEEKAKALAEMPLPPGWTEMKSPEGKVYYFNAMESKSQWNRPTMPEKVPEKTPRPSGLAGVFSKAADAVGMTITISQEKGHEKDANSKDPDDLKLRKSSTDSQGNPTTPSKSSLVKLLAGVKRTPKQNKDDDKSGEDDAKRRDSRDDDAKSRDSLVDSDHEEGRSRASSLTSSKSKVNLLDAFKSTDESTKKFLAKLGSPTNGFTEDELTRIMIIFDEDKDGQLNSTESDRFLSKLVKYGKKGYVQADVDRWYADLADDQSKILKPSQMNKAAVSARKEKREKDQAEVNAKELESKNMQAEAQSKKMSAFLEQKKLLDEAKRKEDAKKAEEEAKSKPLAEGWTEQKADNGKVYYFNAKTGKSSWKRPVADPVVPAAANSEFYEETKATKPKKLFDFLKGAANPAKDNNEPASPSGGVLKVPAGSAKDLIKVLGPIEQGFTEAELASIFEYFDSDRDNLLSVEDSQRFFSEVVKYKPGTSDENIPAWYNALGSNDAKILSRAAMSKAAVADRKNRTTRVSKNADEAANKKKNILASGNLIAGALGPLPLGWEEQKTADGKTFFYNKTTGKSKWKRPTDAEATIPASSTNTDSTHVASPTDANAPASALRPLAAGWEQQVTAEGKVFYYNKVSGKSKWKRPVAEASQVETESQEFSPQSKQILLAEVEKQRQVLQEEFKQQQAVLSQKMAEEVEKQKLAFELAEQKRQIAEDRQRMMTEEVERQRVQLDVIQKTRADEAEAQQKIFQEEFKKVSEQAAEAEQKRVALEETMAKQLADLAAESEKQRLVFQEAEQERLKVLREKQVLAEEIQRKIEEDEVKHKEQLLVEAEKLRMAAEELKTQQIQAETKRLEMQAEIERRKSVAIEIEKLHLQAEVEKQKLASEFQQQRMAAEELKRNLLLAEAQNVRLTELDAQRQALAAEESERLKWVAEAEAQRAVLMETEMQQLAASAEKQRIASDSEKRRLAALSESQRRASEELKMQLEMQQAENQRLATCHGQASDDLRKLRAAAEAELRRLSAELEKQRVAAADLKMQQIAAAKRERERVAEQEQERKHLEENQAERIKLAEALEKSRAAASEAKKLEIATEMYNQRLAAEAERRKLLAETERQRVAFEDLKQKQIAAESERQRLLVDAERQRFLTLEAENKQLAAERERKRLIAESDKHRAALEELKRQRQAAAEAEKKRIMDAEAEKRRWAMADGERVRLAEEAEKLRTAVEESRRQQLLAELDKQRIAGEEAKKLQLRAEALSKQLAAESEIQRMLAESERKKLATEVQRQQQAATELNKRLAAAAEAEIKLKAGLELEMARVAMEANNAFSKNIASDLQRVQGEQELARLAKEATEQREAATEAKKLQAVAEEQLKQYMTNSAASSKTSALDLEARSEIKRLEEERRRLEDESVRKIAEAEAERQRVLAERAKDKLALEEARKMQLAAEEALQRLLESKSAQAVLSTYEADADRERFAAEERKKSILAPEEPEIDLASPRIQEFLRQQLKQQLENERQEQLRKHQLELENERKRIATLHQIELENERKRIATLDAQRKAAEAESLRLSLELKKMPLSDNLNLAPMILSPSSNAASSVAPLKTPSNYRLPSAEELRSFHPTSTPIDTSNQSGVGFYTFGTTTPRMGLSRTVQQSSTSPLSSPFSTPTKEVKMALNSALSECKLYFEDLENAPAPGPLLTESRACRKCRQPAINHFRQRSESDACSLTYEDLQGAVGPGPLLNEFWLCRKCDKLQADHRRGQTTHATPQHNNSHTDEGSTGGAAAGQQIINFAAQSGKGLTSAQKKPVGQFVDNLFSAFDNYY